MKNILTHILAKTNCLLAIAVLTTGISNKAIAGCSIGDVTATAASSILCTSFSANWNAPGSGTPANYYLEVSTSPTFAVGSDVATYPKYIGSTALTYSVTGLTGGNTTYYYRVKAYCSASGGGLSVNWSNTITVVVNVAGCYCTPSGGSGATGYLSNVTLNTINDTRTAWVAGGYLNTGLSTSLEQGVPYTLSVQKTTTAYKQYISVWIDWNNNGVLDDAGETLMDNVQYNTTTGSETQSLTITVPTTAVVASTRMRVGMKYQSVATLTGPCDPYATYIEWLDYTITVTAGSSMTYTSSTTTQASTATVTQGSTGNEIIGVQIVTAHGLNPLSATSFSFTTVGSGAASTNAGTDIKLAKLYYTGTSSTFAATNQVGTTAFAPSGAFTITSSEELTPGTNYFWLTYDINTAATVTNLVDASCTATNFGGPSATNPAGTRSIVALTTGAYCAVTGTCTNDYISNVSFVNIANSSTCAGVSGYNNYTAQSTTVYVGDNYQMIIDAYSNTKCCAGLYYSAVSVFIDWNRNGVFTDAGETVLQGVDISASTINPYELVGSITVPDQSVLGSTRMRVIAAGQTTAPAACTTPITYGEIEDYTVVIDEHAEMTLSSIVTTQNNTTSVNAGTFQNEMIGVKITTTGSVNALVANSFTFKTTNTTSAANDLSKAQFWSGGNNATFAITKQFGADYANPPATPSTFSFSGSTETLEEGDNYFWLTYDVKCSAPGTDIIDAECTTTNLGAPTPTSPAGSRAIVASTAMAYVSSTTTQNTSGLAKSSTNNQIIGISIVVSGCSTPISATSFSFNTTGCTAPATDITNAKLFFTGTSGTFSTTTQVGSTVAAPSGAFTITPTVAQGTLAAGTNYFWLTYDIPAGAVCINNINPSSSTTGLVDAQCTSVTVGTAKTPSITAPGGNRYINCGTAYYSNGSNPPNKLSSWNSKRDGTGTAPTAFSSGNDFYVQVTHTMTATATATLSNLYIESGGYVKASYLLTMTTLHIGGGGTYEQAVKAGNFTYITNFFIENYGTWLHNNAGELPNSNNYFSPRSNQWFYQWGGGTFPSGTTWGNVLLNGTTTGNFDIGGVLLSIQGDFEIRKDGSSSNYLVDGTTETYNIGGNYTISGGAFKGTQKGAVLTFNVSGDLIVSAGTLQDNSGSGGGSTILNVGGNVTITGGTVNLNVNAGVSQMNLDLINVYGTIPLTSSNNWSQTGGTVTLGNTTIKTGKTITMTGSKAGDVASGTTFTINSGGRLNCDVYPVTGAGAFTVPSGATIGLGATNSQGALTSTASAGNVQVTGTRTFNAGGTYVYMGAANQFTGNQLPAIIGAAGPVGGLQIANTATNGTVTLTQNTAVIGALTLTSGFLKSVSASPYLTLGNGTQSATISGGSATSFVSNYMKWIVTTSTATTYTYPIGECCSGTIRYRKLDLTPKDATLRTWDLTFVNSNPTTLGTTIETSPAQLINGVEAYYYWQLTPLGAGTPTSRFKLYSDASDSYDWTACYVAHFASDSKWDSWDQTLATNFGCDGAAYTTWVNWDVGTYSPVAKGKGAPLPIKLLSFNAYPAQSKVLADWLTATEINNDYFTVYRSKDGENWEEVTRVKGAGNSSTTLNYEAKDIKPYKGVSYYRLKQTDNDGAFTYSNIVAVDIKENTVATLYVFPNPANDKLNIVIGENEKATVKIYDVTGQVVSESNICNMQSAICNVDISTLSKGVYFVSLTDDAGVRYARFVKE